MEKDNLLFLRRLHGRIHEWRIKKQESIILIKCLVWPFGKKVYLIGTPEHTNIGDSAIVLAEKAFLEKSGFKKNQIKEITLNEYSKYSDIIKKCVRKNQLICWLGGGNMGDQWLGEEYFRRNAMADFKENPMIIFPQTIYYTNTEGGKKEKELSVKYYDGNDRLTIVAREKISFDIMRELYPNVKILLTPDIVLSSTKELYGIKKEKRTDILLCMRNDSEKSLSIRECKIIEDILRKKVGDFKRTDMMSDIPVTKENREVCVQRKMREFAHAKLVVTDRLHGMVFAAITETPCIVFSNYNQKVSGTYEWIKGLNYIHYVNSVEELEKEIENLLEIKEGVFGNSTWSSAFNKLEETIKQYTM